MKNTIMIFIYVIPIVLAIVYALLYLLNKVKASKIYLIIISVIVASLTVSMLIIPSCGSVGNNKPAEPYKPLPEGEAAAAPAAPAGPTFEDRVKEFSDNFVDSDNPYLADDGFIYFGEYPQRVVTDASIINTLNQLSISDINENGYYEYNGNQYAKVRTTRSGEFISTGTKMYANRYYWFKVEPIKWFPLYPSGNEIWLVSNCILDGSYYRNVSPCDESNDECIDDDGYLNEYEYSDLRQALEAFYDNAFSYYEKKDIELIEFECYDYTMVLSSEEIDAVLSFYENWYPKFTDYDIAKGIDTNLVWTRWGCDDNQNAYVYSSDGNYYSEPVWSYYGYTILINIDIDKYQ